MPEGYRARSLYGIQKGIAPKDFAAWKEFERESLKKQFDGIFLLFGDQLYLAPKDMPALKGLKVLRPGLHLGTMKKGGLNRHMRWHFRFRLKRQCIAATFPVTARRQGSGSTV